MKQLIRSRGLTWLRIAAVGLLFAAPAAQALVSGERSRTCPEEGGTYTDYFGGTYTGDPSNPFAPFRVVIPDHGWNGKLLAYARGTGSSVKTIDGKAVDVDGNAITDFESQAPLLGFTPLNNALPEITADGLRLPTNPDAFEEQLVCKDKYAAVVSDYKPDFDFLLNNGKLGWVVEDGIRDIGLAIAQARRLLRRSQGRLPSRTILLGRSQGSLVALRYAEERSLLVDGVVTACTVGAGASRSWDSAVDIALAIDEAFRNPTAGLGGWRWGATEGDVGNVNDDVVFATDVVPILQGWFTDPTAFARLEFVRLVNRLPRDGFYPFPAPAVPGPEPAVPGFYETESPGYPTFNWLGTLLLFTTEVKADLEGRAGGAVGQNLDHSYSLDDADRAYLNALGLPSEALDGWLAMMNARRTYAGSPQGRDYTAKYRDFSFDGWLPPRPMLSVHTTTDGLVFPSQETALRETLDATGRPLKQRQLRQTFVKSNGHCTLTREEWTRALEVMETRLDTGVWPEGRFVEEIKCVRDPDDPTDPGVPVGCDLDTNLRFDDSFDPGPYPQPPSD